MTRAVDCGVAPAAWIEGGSARLENGKPVTVDKLMRVLESMGLRMLIVPKSLASDLQVLVQHKHKSEAP
jgi:hypothetical protein